MEQELIQQYMETVRLYQQNMATIFRTMGPLLRTSRMTRQGDHTNTNTTLNNVSYNSQTSPISQRNVQDQTQYNTQTTPITSVRNIDQTLNSNVSTMGRNLLNTILSPLNNNVSNIRSSTQRDTNNIHVPGMFSYYSNLVSNNNIPHVRNAGNYRRRHNNIPFNFFGNRNSFTLGNNNSALILSTEMINQITEELVYSDLSTNYDVCPIDLIPFDASENVVRITHCGHIFRGPNIRRWLQTNHVCPVCRCNLINIYNNMSDNNQQGNQNNTSHTNEEILDNELNNLIEEERTNENHDNQENIGENQYDGNETKEEETEENTVGNTLEETLINTFNNAIQTTLNDASLNADLNIQYLFFNPDDQINSSNRNNG